MAQREPWVLVRCQAWAVPVPVLALPVPDDGPVYQGPVYPGIPGMVPMLPRVCTLCG